MLKARGPQNQCVRVYKFELGCWEKLHRQAFFNEQTTKINYKGYYLEYRE